MPRSRRPLRFSSALLTLSLLLACFIVAKPATVAAQPAFGVNYWPKNFDASVLTNANWTAATKVTVQKDLDQMASLGVRVVRLTLAPWPTGYTLNAGAGNACTHGTSTGIVLTTYNQITANLPTMLGYLQARGMKVIVSFHNEYMRTGCWVAGYGAGGFSTFLNDSRTWTQGIVNAAKNSAYAASVLYYDLCNEAADDQSNTWAYVNGIYDGGFVPTGKRGVSILQVPRDSDKLKQQLGTRIMDFVDFHSYPAASLNSNIEASYDSVKGKFASSTVLLGEFGRSTKYCINSGSFLGVPQGRDGISCVTTAECATTSFPAGTCSGDDEPTQSATDFDLINRSINKGIPYYLHWTLWDGDYPTNAFGLGYSEQIPKDVVGAISARLNIVSNPDMEQLTGSVPTGWASGGTVPVAFSAGFGDSATGTWYGRIRVDNQSTGTVWIVSPITSVAGKTMLDVNFYARSTMSLVHAEIHEYNSSGVETRLTSAPSYTPTAWAMNNYHHKISNSWRLTLLPTTSTIRFAVVASLNAANPDYLDVDTVSVYAR